MRFTGQGRKRDLQAVLPHVQAAHERNMESGGKPGESVTVIPFLNQWEDGLVRYMDIYSCFCRNRKRRMKIRSEAGHHSGKPGCEKKGGRGLLCYVETSCFRYQQC